jgi:hypothetical protein
MQNRRFTVPFDPEFFARRAESGEDATSLAAFRHAYATNHWGGAESPSGPGASFDQTAAIRRKLPELCHRLGVRTLLDLPCGDCSWMSNIDLGPVRYIGADLIPELIEETARRHARPGREFQVLDLLSSPLPDADLVLCRDCLVHLSFADIVRAIANLRRSRITYLLTTTFTEQRDNEDIRTGDWRPLNLEIAPFNWSRPEHILNEECTEANGVFADKSLGLWRLDTLRHGYSVTKAAHFARPS